MLSGAITSTWMYPLVCPTKRTPPVAISVIQILSTLPTIPWYGDNDSKTEVSSRLRFFHFIARYLLHPSSRASLEKPRCRCTCRKRMSTTKTCRFTERCVLRELILLYEVNSLREILISLTSKWDVSLVQTISSNVFWGIQLIKCRSDVLINDN
uniref:Uncharacterized protein n=1 Tax=Zea mays TaxID=4577 RepID=B7ZZQ6_MAIZE|nr:unknown [Zea mays]